MSTQQQEYRPSSPFPLHWLMLGGAATYMLSKRPEKGTRCPAPVSLRLYSSDLPNIARTRCQWRSAIHKLAPSTHYTCMPAVWSSCVGSRIHAFYVHLGGAEILEVTGQSSKEKAYMMTLGVFVACFCVSTFVRNRMLGSKMSLFGGGTPPQAAPAAPASNAGAAPATGKSKKKSKKAD